jgi:hypothetical protein
MFSNSKTTSIIQRLDRTSKDLFSLLLLLNLKISPNTMSIVRGKKSQKKMVLHNHTKIRITVFRCQIQNTASLLASIVTFKDTISRIAQHPHEEEE